MKLNTILENMESHRVYPYDIYGYVIEFNHEQKLALKTVVTGEVSTQEQLFQSGDRLSVNYEIQHDIPKNSVVFEVKSEMQNRVLQDGQFDIDENPQDLELLKKDILLKIEAFKPILDNENMRVIEKTYNKLWKKINELQKSS